MARSVAFGFVASAMMAIGVDAEPLFEDVLPAAGIDHFGKSYGFAWRDYDSDGDPDIWLTNHGRRSTLYTNNGDGSFSLAFIPPADLVRAADTHGVGWADIDNDGDADLLEIAGGDQGFGSGQRNRLFTNDGGDLLDEAEQYGIDYPLGRGRYPLWFDYDGDGALDVLITNVARADGLAPSALFRNLGFSFEDMTAATGLVIGESGHFTGGLLSDVSRDRKLDLLLFRARTRPYQRVFRIDKEPFLQPDPSPLQAIVNTGNVVGAVAQDFNADLQSDILAVRSTGFPDLRRFSNSEFGLAIPLGVNSPSTTEQPKGVNFDTAGDVTFRVNRFAWDISKIFIGAFGFQPSAPTFSLSSADPDVVGLSGPHAGVDIGVYIGRTNGTWIVRITGDSGGLHATIKSSRPIQALEPVGFSLQSTPCQHPSPCRPFLLLSNTSGSYDDMTIVAGLNHGLLCPAAVAADFDNDMDVDLYLVCAGPAGNVPNQLFLNRGDGTFTGISDHGAEGAVGGRGDRAAVADYDSDGFVDIFVANGTSQFEGPDQLFRNLGNDNHWLKLNLRGTESNRDGVGARVELTTQGITQLREQTGGLQFGTQDHRVLHFGLGVHANVEHIVVYWPSGNVRQLFDIAADQVITVIEDAADMDEDGDGLPDVWEYTHNLAPLDASDADLDPDGDGHSNTDEFQAGSDPNVPDVRDSIRAIDAPLTVPSSGTVRVTVDYGASTTRDLLLSLKSTIGSWWGGRVIERNIGPGVGEAIIDFPIRFDPPQNEELIWTVRILPVGRDWPESLAFDTRGPVTAGE